ncbi:ComE operon protein 2 [Virgibacillus alimentarius]|uniref:ComE operon protein 2 n=1 Tax=Virgibacillus alimentarius TaxID=698769 RepID=A0ABS4S837_9BACI|nr:MULTISPECIES: ComE operon protein 2 [Virgibacillus]MBP2256567.1 dCMP deaminase [Virgibacillus alimentarius]HLR66513.1 ComE operon protein 2 [Virgibacillus sp.]
MERISWDQYFMAQSHLLALRSTCTRLMVGATIVRDKRIIAGGYNGSVSGSVHCNDEGCYVIDGHCVRTVHAEANALLQCAKFGVPTDNADIYVTHYPCLQCCKQLIQSGIKTVYYAEDYRNHPYAIELFQEAGVETKKVELNYLAVDTKYKEKSAYVQHLLEKLELNTNEQELSVLKKQAKQLFTPYSQSK